MRAGVRKSEGDKHEKAGGVTESTSGQGNVSDSSTLSTYLGSP